MPVPRLFRHCQSPALPDIVRRRRQVFPAASFVQTAKYYGADTIEFNLETTSNNFYFDKHIMGKAGTTFPKFVDELIAKIKGL